MANPDTGLRRVAVYADTAHADLALPAGVPVATLIAAIVDLLPGRYPSSVPRSYRLGLLGRAALDGSKSLAQQGIRDGDVLALTRADMPVPQPRFDDAAEQVAAAVRATVRPWTPVTRRLTAALAASGLAGVAGFVAVPGPPGTPNALLAVAATGTVTALSVPSSGCSGPVRTTLCCLAGLAVAVAVAGMAVAVSGISLQAVGAGTAVGAVALVRSAGRFAAMVTGLSRQPEPLAADTAQELLSGLVTAAVAAAVLGAAGVAAGAPVTGVPGFVGVAFTAVAGATLLLRARSHTDGRQITALVSGGAAVLGIALVTAGVGIWPHRPWPATAAVGLAGAALAVGFVEAPWPPLARRAAELAEGVMLGTLVPLAGWLCGVYGAARGLALG